MLAVLTMCEDGRILPTLPQESLCIITICIVTPSTFWALVKLNAKISQGKNLQITFGDPCSFSGGAIAHCFRTKPARTSVVTKSAILGRWFSTPKKWRKCATKQGEKMGSDTPTKFNEWHRRELWNSNFGIFLYFCRGCKLTGERC